MTETTEAVRTVRCVKCRRAVHTDVSKNRRYGSGCCRYVNAVARALDGLGTVPASKAAEALRDAAAVPTGRPGVYRFVSSDGTRTYLTHPKICSCPAGRALVFCYHRIVVSVLCGLWGHEPATRPAIPMGSGS